MDTVTSQPAGRTAASGLRRAAMGILAGGSSAAELLAWAEDDALVERIAARSGRPAEDLRNEMIAVSWVVDKITREGLTPERCRAELGLRDGKDGDPA